jgi:hypothetical protein
LWRPNRTRARIPEFVSRLTPQGCISDPCPELASQKSDYAEATGDSAEDLARILAASGHVLAAPEATDRRHAAFVADDAAMLAAVSTTML